MVKNSLEKIWLTMSNEDVVQWLIERGYSQTTVEAYSQAQLKEVFTRVYETLSEYPTKEIEL